MTLELYIKKKEAETYLKAHVMININFVCISLVPSSFIKDFINKLSEHTPSSVRFCVKMIKCIRFTYLIIHNY